MCRSWRAFPRAVQLALVFAAMTPDWAAAQFNGRHQIDRFQLGTENFLDWKAWQPLPQWKYQFYTAPNAFEASVGSLSRAHFLFFHQIRLEADIGEYAAFLYDQREEGFFRSDAIYQEVELRLGKGVYGSIVGWVDQDKRYNNIGFAASYGERTDWTYVRLSRNNQYQQFDQKNGEGLQEPLRYEPTPVLNRIDARHFWNDRLFMQASVKQEERARLEDRGAGVDYEYEGQEFDLIVDWWGPGQEWLVGLNGRLDEERRVQSPRGGSSGLIEERQTLRLQWWDIYHGRRLESGDLINFGYLDGHFSNRIASPSRSLQFGTLLTTQMAYATWETGPGAAAHGVFGLFAGQPDLDLRKGAGPVRADDVKHWEGKLSAGLVIENPDAWRFAFLTSWDLDLVEGRVWDGGNVQVQIRF